MSCHLLAFTDTALSALHDRSKSDYLHFPSLCTEVMTGGVTSLGILHEMFYYQNVLA